MTKRELLNRLMHLTPELEIRIVMPDGSRRDFETDYQIIHGIGEVQLIVDPDAEAWL